MNFSLHLYKNLIPQQWKLFITCNATLAIKKRKRWSPTYPAPGIRAGDTMGFRSKFDDIIRWGLLSSGSLPHGGPSSGTCLMWCASSLNEPDKCRYVAGRDGMRGRGVSNFEFLTWNAGRSASFHVGIPVFLYFCCASSPEPLEGEWSLSSRVSCVHPARPFRITHVTCDSNPWVPLNSN